MQMNQKEQIAQFKEHIAANFSKPDNLKKILSKLDEIEMTYQLLKETDIGKVVLRISISNKKCSCPEEREVYEKANEIITKWKKLQKKKEEKTLKNEQCSNPAGSQQEAGPKEEQKGQSLVGQVITGIPMRDGVIKKLKEIFLQKLTIEDQVVEPEEDISSLSDNLSTRVEKLLHNTFLKDQREYVQKVRSISFNLQDAKNPWLRWRLLSRELSPEEFVKMSPKEMASDQLKKMREEAMKQDQEARRSDWMREQLLKNPNNKGVFKCFKCGKNNTIYYQLQTSSADEPMTNFITCIECGNKWKSR